MRILSVNAWPMGSSCPIGYMGEHLFNDSHFEVLELVSRDVPVYCSFTKRYIVDFNRFRLSLQSPREIQSDGVSESHRSNFVRSRIKAIAKSLTPLRINSKACEELRAFKPDVIYTQGYDIRILIAADKLAGLLGVPCVTHTLDWWFSDDTLVKALQMRALNRCISRSCKHLAGSPKMAEWIESAFHTTALFVTNCCIGSAIKDTGSAIDWNGAAGLHFLYAGNLTPCRHLSLNILARHLRPKDKLIVYAPSNQIEEVDLDSRIEIHSSVPQSDVLSLYARADVLVHVESFDKASESFARYSLSTKVAEYLATGKPILYFGPRDIGVGDFFYRTGCANVANEESEIDAAIYALTKDLEDSARIDRCRQVFECLFETNAVRQRLMSCLEGR